MNETTEPLEELMVEVAPLDPIHEIHILREVNRRWRRAAIGSIFVAVLLGIVSVVQFAGTFITCRQLNEVREEGARNKQEAQESIVRLREAAVRADIIATSNFNAFERADNKFREIYEKMDWINLLARNHREDIQLLAQLEADVAEARENLIAVETIRQLLEQDEETRAKMDPRTYADPKQRCPYVPGANRKPPEPE